MGKQCKWPMKVLWPFAKEFDNDFSGLPDRQFFLSADVLLVAKHLRPHLIVLDDRLHVDCALNLPDRLRIGAPPQPMGT